jgi:cytosine/adenosine deaminase-related metal-dependent hydrolase
MRQALLLQRVARGADAMSAREALEIATLGGAQVLGRDDWGSIAPGMRADLAIWDVSGIEAAGAWDPVAALVLCGPGRVRDLYRRRAAGGAGWADGWTCPCAGTSAVWRWPWRGSCFPALS